ncbi:MAG: biotin transporter BioY, partial [Synechococcus sp.]
LQLCGLFNIALGSLLGRWDETFVRLVMDYSLGPLPLQLALCAATGVLAVVIRWCLLIRE